MTDEVTDSDVEIFADHLYTEMREKLQLEAAGDVERLQFAAVQGNDAPYIVKWSELSAKPKSAWMSLARTILLAASS